MAPKIKTTRPMLEREGIAGKWLSDSIHDTAVHCGWVVWTACSVRASGLTPFLPMIHLSPNGGHRRRYRGSLWPCLILRQHPPVSVTLADHIRAWGMSLQETSENMHRSSISAAEIFQTWTYAIYINIRSICKQRWSSRKYPYYPSNISHCTSKHAFARPKVRGAEHGDESEAKNNHEQDGSCWLWDSRDRQKRIIDRRALLPTLSILHDDMWQQDLIRSAPQERCESICEQLLPDDRSLTYLFHLCQPLCSVRLQTYATVSMTRVKPWQWRTKRYSQLCLPQTIHSFHWSGTLSSQHCNDLFSLQPLPHVFGKLRSSHAESATTVFILNISAEAVWLRLRMCDRSDWFKASDGADRGQFRGHILLRVAGRVRISIITNGFDIPNTSWLWGSVRVPYR